MITVIRQKNRGTNFLREIKTIQQLQNWGQEIHEVTSENLSPQLLVEVLRWTQGGFDDIVVNHPQSMELKALKKQCYTLQFNQALEFIMSHPELLRTPIILENDKLLVGYNEEEIRAFIPRLFKNVVVSH